MGKTGYGTREENSGTIQKRTERIMHFYSPESGKYGGVKVDNEQEEI